eukprot:401053-Pleurochrysis_carterae.AAC.4
MHGKSHARRGAHEEKRRTREGMGCAFASLESAQGAARRCPVACVAPPWWCAPGALSAPRPPRQCARPGTSMQRTSEMRRLAAYAELAGVV